MANVRPQHPHHLFSRGCVLGLLCVAPLISAQSLYTCEKNVCIGFTHDGGAEALVLDTLARAQTSIDMAAYAFSSKKIATALLAARQRGVTVRIVLDQVRAGDRYSSAIFLHNQGFAVRTLTLNNKAAMHHKFMVVDGRHVQTGSFNYTRAAAERNAESVVRLESLQSVRLYNEEWQRIWQLAAP